jgi:hypothetical protein
MFVMTQRRSKPSQRGRHDVRFFYYLTGDRLLTRRRTAAPPARRSPIERPGTWPLDELTFRGED